MTVSVHLGRPGRPRRPARSRRRDLGGPHRPATDHPDPQRPQRRLRPPRARDDRDPRRQGRPQSLRAHRQTLEQLGAAYKRVNAPLGQFGLDVIEINDAAVRATDQARYAQLAEALQQLGDQRNTIAAGMRTLLEQAAFGNAAMNEQQARRRCSRAPTPWPRRPGPVRADGGAPRAAANRRPTPVNLRRRVRPTTAFLTLGGRGPRVGSHYPFNAWRYTSGQGGRQPWSRAELSFFRTRSPRSCWPPGSRRGWPTTGPTARHGWCPSGSTGTAPTS